MSSAPKPRYSGEDEGVRLEEQIRALLADGQIWEAQNLFNTAGDLLPADSKLREVLSPPRIRTIDYRDVDRSPEFAWINAHAGAYQGKWVALVGENLVASSDSLKELLAKLHPLQFERKPLIHHLI
jgi:Family of unknown function (DUF5678)